MLKKSFMIFFLLILVLFLSAIIYINVARSPEALPPLSQSLELIKPGRYGVQWQDVTFIDTSRTTAAVGDYPGDSKRRLLTRIWWPEKKTLAMPLVIYSHGFMSTRLGGSYIAEHLASLGYVVAAANFPLTHYDFEGEQQVADVINQPQDVSFIIDQVLIRNQNINDELYQRIDPERIAVAGMSLGGMTTTLVAYHHQWADARIKAAVSIAGPSSMFSKQFFKRDLPFLMVATPTDAMVDYATNAADIHQRIDASVLVTLNNASHAGFSFQSRPLGFLDNPDQVGCWAIANKIQTDDIAPWFSQLGHEAQGIILPKDRGLCQIDPLPKVMHPIYQQQLNQLAVTAFMQCHLSDDKKDEQRYCDFLHESLAAEIESITVSQ